MPPKAARGRGGRGGRGGKRQPPSDSATPGPSGTASRNAPAAADAASQEQERERERELGQTSPPTGSPAAAPTTTPRTGQVQRLHSLTKPRAQGGSLVPLNPDGSAPKPTLRYQPKAIARRSREERAEREKAEAEKRHGRIAEAEAAAKSTERRRRAVEERGEGDRGRGRGRGRGSGSDRGGRGGGRGGGSVGDGDAKVKTEHAVPRTAVSLGSSSIHTLPDAAGGDRSSDESDSGPRRFNIDDINDLSDSEHDDDEHERKKGTAAGKGKDPARIPFRPAPRPLRPVRVERQRHVQRVVDINTEASASKSAELKKQAEQKDADESLCVEGDRPDVEEVSGTAASKDNAATADDGVRAPQVKEEPLDADVTMVDSVSPATADDDGRAPAADKESGELSSQERKKDAVEDRPRSKLQTAEERQELDRREQDLEYLRKVLGSVSTTATTDDDGRTAEGDTKMLDGDQKAEEPKDERHGKLFLFQFPPITPKLKDPGAPEDDSKDREDVVEVAPPPSSSHQPGTSRASEPPVTVKTEQEEQPNGGPTPLTSQKPGTSSQLLNAARSDLPPGRVGKLQVHKSGATTIDWGGISLKLDRGSDVGFLQDAVVVSEDATDKRVWAMSQVSGKWVVTPDWDRLLDG